MQIKSFDELEIKLNDISHSLDEIEKLLNILFDSFEDIKLKHIDISDINKFFIIMNRFL